VSPAPSPIVAVVVSYNRRDLLLECLAAVDGQSRRPDAIVVVDNASTDGSAEAVRAKFPEVDVVELVANTGGAGGFAVGMSHARSTYDASLLWIMDDDTIPEPTALEELVRVYDGHRPTPSVVASTVVWTDGQVMGRNKPKVLFERTPGKVRRAARWDCTPMRYSTFVSILVDTSVHPDLEVIADFFLWGDDTEFSAALIRRAPGLLSQRSVAVHKTPGFGARIEDPGPRFFYAVRNRFWIVRRRQAFGWFEGLLWLFGAIPNWANWFRGSQDRREFLRLLRTGFRDGTQTLPRSNATTLATSGWAGPSGHSGGHD